MKSKTYNVIIVILISLGICLFMSSCGPRKEVSKLGSSPSLPAWPDTTDGKPNFHYSLPAAYWIWYDKGGWHLRVTTAGTRNHFRGTVEASGGMIKNFRPARIVVGKDRIKEDVSNDYDEHGSFLISVQEGTKIKVVGERVIRFDFWSDEDIYGFDWRSSSGCNEFNIYIDGARRPERIFIGASAYNPSSAVFDACR